MVNVPGRSKGCKTCRSRKIKCTFERPECAKCINSGRTCLGYQRERVFIHSNLGIEVAKSQAQARPPPAVTCIDIKSDNKPLEHRSRENGWSDVSSNDSLSSALSMSLVSSSLRQQILALYVSHHETASDSRLITDSRAWLTTLPAIPSPSKALETAAYAVSLARFGATLDAPSIKQEGLKLYSQGLRRTQMALEDPKSMYSDETLAACMLLGVYEIFECPDGSRGAYKSHFNGCAKLIQLRGPGAHTEGLAHSIFQGFRFMGSMEALETRSSFLFSPEWKTVPFSKYPKVPFQKMLDLLLEGSMILRKVDQLPNVGSEKQVAFLVDMLQDCITLDDKMKEFLLEFESFEGGPLYWAVPSKPPDVVGLLDAPVCNDEFNSLSYEFPTVRIGTTMMLYWASLTTLWSGACHIYETIAHQTILSPTVDGKLEGHFTTDEHSQAFQIPPPTRFRAFPTLARNTCQSAEFCLRDENEMLSIIAPLNMILAPLNSWPGLDNEIAWAQNLLLGVQNRGLKIIEYLPRE